VPLGFRTRRLRGVPTHAARRPAHPHAAIAAGRRGRLRRVPARPPGVHRPEVAGLRAPALRRAAPEPRRGRALSRVGSGGKGRRDRRRRGPLRPAGVPRRPPSRASVGPFLRAGGPHGGRARRRARPPGPARRRPSLIGMGELAARQLLPRRVAGPARALLHPGPARAGRRVLRRQVPVLRGGVAAGFPQRAARLAAGLAGARPRAGRPLPRPPLRVRAAVRLGRRCDRGLRARRRGAPLPRQPVTQATWRADSSTAPLPPMGRAVAASRYTGSLPAFSDRSAASTRRTTLRASALS
jgi:hypothetical protein